MKNFILFICLFLSCNASSAQDYNEEPRKSVTFNHINFEYEYDTVQKVYSFIDTEYEKWSNTNNPTTFFSLLLFSKGQEISILPIFVRTDTNLLDITHINAKLNQYKYEFARGEDFIVRKSLEFGKIKETIILKLNSKTFEFVQNFRDVNTLILEIKGEWGDYKFRSSMDTIHHLRRTVRFMHGFTSDF